MAYIKKPKKLPWAPKTEKPAQEGRKVENQKFYNSAAWRKLATYDKLQNPYCVECVLWELKKLMSKQNIKTGKGVLYNIYKQVEKERRNIEKIVKGFPAAPHVLAASFAISKKPISDHIKSIIDGGQMLDPENIQTLCSKHHNRKSGREAHKNST